MLEQKERLDRRLSGGESTQGEHKAGKVGSNDETKPSSLRDISAFPLD